MRITIQAVSCILFASFLSSCSSAKECTPAEAYQIEYFTGGGVTGMERGMTIECSGWVKMWDRKLNSPKEITDSLLLKSSTRKKFAESMDDASIFDYAKKDVSNYTATLILSKQEKQTTIAYPSSAQPADLPAAIKTILSEISSIHK